MQFDHAKKAAKPQGALERDNWETASTDHRHFLLAQYTGILAIATGSEGKHINQNFRSSPKGQLQGTTLITTQIFGM